MAHMIPGDGPREHDPRSREGELYRSLAGLPDDYYVVHSFNLVTVLGNSMQECEADFVVFNRSLGILVIEAKAGAVSYDNGNWVYSNGNPMKRGGPFKQADHVKWQIIQLCKDKGYARILERCKVMHAVWFPSLTRTSISRIVLPSEGDRQLILSADDLNDPEPQIQKIMGIDVFGKTTNLTEADADAIVRNILCPSFSIVPSSRLKYDLADMSFARLIDSQQRVLDFIEDQRFAVIAGIAGSGKTLIALERARRLAESGQRVLFLCYNTLLKRNLEQRCSGYGSIDVRTLAGYACAECHTKETDYGLLGEKLLEKLDHGFEYDHVIVDEGQDFGREAIEQALILQTLHELVEDNGGTLYLFYDQNQLVQGANLPAVIRDADCKITLYTNCRNTHKVAGSSMKALPKGTKYRMAEFCPTGSIATLFASTDPGEQERFIDSSIAQLKEVGLTDIAILTCKTESGSALQHLTHGGPEEEKTRHWKSTRIPFVSCRRFKGLEADAVILVDVDESLWSPDDFAATGDDRIMYTGMSRAKHELKIVCNMDADACRRVLKSCDLPVPKDPIKGLAKSLGALKVNLQ